MKNILFFISLSFCVGFTTSTTLAQYAQIDSLHKVIQVLKKGKNFEADTNYINTVFALVLPIRYVYLDSMFYYAQKSLSLSQKIQFKSIQPKIIRQIGNYHYYKNEYYHAISYYKQGLAIAQAIKDQESIAFGFYNLGLVNLMIGEYEISIEYLLQAEPIFENIRKTKLNLTAWLAHTYNSIAEAYQFQKLWDKSIEYHQKSIQASRIISYQYGIATSLNNIGYIYIEQGKYKEAFEVLFNAKNILDKIDITPTDRLYTTSYTLSYIGLAYSKQNRLEEAFNYTKQAYDISSKIKNKTNQTEYGNLLIGILFKQKQYDKVLEYGLPILAIAREINNKSAIQGIVGTLANVYEVKKNYQEAFYYQKLSKNYTDSVFNDESRKKMLHIEAHYKFEKKEAILKAEQQIKDIENEKKLTQQRYYIYIAFLIVIALFLLIILIQRSRKIQQRLNNQLSKQNNTLQKQQEEITSQNEELSQQQDQLAHVNIRLEEEVAFKQKLIETQNRELLNYALKIADSNDFLEEVKKGIMSQENPQQNKNLLSKIESSQNKEKDWDTFKKMFEDVNPTFFRQLAISYPELTAQELKLCALIKLNLSSKDIASILRITPESVYKARYRTRKKMNIDNEENLNNLLFKME